jgi:hypothetical protein
MLGRTIGATQNMPLRSTDFMSSDRIKWFNPTKASVPNWRMAITIGGRKVARATWKQA